MLHDSGFCEIYRADHHESEPPPREITLELVASDYFGDLTIGVTRYYSAAAASRQINRFIEVWQDRSLTEGLLCRLAEDEEKPGEWYLIDKVDHTADSDGILVSRITLIDTDGSSWEGILHGDSIP